MFVEQMNESFLKSKVQVFEGGGKGKQTMADQGQMSSSGAPGKDPSGPAHPESPLQKWNVSPVWLPLPMRRAGLVSDRAGYCLRSGVETTLGS